MAKSRQVEAFGFNLPDQRRKGVKENYGAALFEANEERIIATMRLRDLEARVKGGRPPETSYKERFIGEFEKKQRWYEARGKYDASNKTVAQKMALSAEYTPTRDRQAFEAISEIYKSDSKNYKELLDFVGIKRSRGQRYGVREVLAIADYAHYDASLHVYIVRVGNKEGVIKFPIYKDGEKVGDWKFYGPGK